MKNLKKLLLNFSLKRGSGISLGLLISSVMVGSCDLSNVPRLPDTKINPAFESSPPIAQRISMEILNEPLKTGENIRLMVEFEDKSPVGQVLAINVNQSKIVLRDDGKGADLKENDGIFSVFIAEDLDLLNKEFKLRQEKLLGEGELVKFENRKKIPVKLDKIRQFDFDRMQRGRVFDIPLDLIWGGILNRINQQKSLLINHINVVEDTTRTFNPCTNTGNRDGVWTFGALMRQMASSSASSIATNEQASTFVLNWLNSWNSSHTINDEGVPSRINIQNRIINPWLSRSALAGAPSGQLLMEFAPFKLIGIVNRLDLRGNSGYGFSNAGEGRFVFSAFDLNSCNPLQFTVILEYGINKRGCEVKEFGESWASLNTMPLGSQEYNETLENITVQFTQAGTNNSKPNGNSINQIRTNEIALGSPWELREFSLNPSGQLELVTVKMEPAVKYNAKVNNADVRRLAQFINSLTVQIENNDYDVPEEIPLTAGTASPTTGFLGAKSHTPFPPTGTPPNVNHWNGTPLPGPAFIISNEARHIFSLNTCSGCHGGETQTFFTHINPSAFGSPAGLSGFLTGITVADAAARPTGNPTMREFSDLERRQADLNNLITNDCHFLPIIDLMAKLRFEPVRMTH